jgi:hypothetical protein
MEFMLQAYATHLAKSEWVVDGSLPPDDEEWESYSIEVLTLIDDCHIIAYAYLPTGWWFNAKTHDKIETPKAWRLLK